MISSKKLHTILNQTKAKDDSPYSTFIRPDKDIVMDKGTLNRIISELLLRRIGDWHEEKIRLVD